ncbi:hypothetical protein [Comamonas sp. C24C]
MCEPTTLLAAGALAGAATSIYQGEQSRKSQNQAADQAKQAAQKTALQAEEATNAANAKTPDTAALGASNREAAASGQGSTMLTGPAGIDPNSLTLGRNTLLGQ